MHISTIDCPQIPKQGVHSTTMFLHNYGIVCINMQVRHAHQPPQRGWHSMNTGVTACWQHACHSCTAAAPLLVAMPCCGMHLSDASARDRRKLRHGAAPNLMGQPQLPCCLALFGVSWPARAFEPLSSTQDVKLELLSSCTPLKTFIASSNSGSSQPPKQLAVSCCSH